MWDVPQCIQLADRLNVARLGSHVPVTVLDHGDKDEGNASDATIVRLGNYSIARLLAGRGAGAAWIAMSDTALPRSAATLRA